MTLDDTASRERETPRPSMRNAASVADADSAQTGATQVDVQSGRNVLVRMYNVGFGDCFLIELPMANRTPVRVLIDCGSIAAPDQFGIKDVVATLLSDVPGDDGKPCIDVVVCTHRHADHVSGFARSDWKDLDVKEVWFPWTEDPADPEAKQVRETQSRLALALQKHWQSRLNADADNSEAERWLELSVNAMSNNAAMSMLHGGFKSKPSYRYLSSEGAPIRIESEVLPGISVYVLGPSRSDSVIRDMIPPSGTTYLRQLAIDDGTSDAFQPFADDWVVDPESFEWSALQVTPADMKKLRDAGSAWDPSVTVALEQAVNGTSLVLAFEIDDVVLFFPGDAQWGTWKSFMEHPETRELLGRAKFWKVGHHGSHNATPQDFVKDTVPATCCAMMSTRTGKFSSIPRVPLLDAIHEKGIPLARSDEPAQAPVSFGQRNQSIIEAVIPIGQQ